MKIFFFRKKNLTWVVGLAVVIVLLLLLFKVF